MEGWLRVVLNHSYLSPTLCVILPFLRCHAGKGLETAEECSAGREAGFVGHLVHKHVRMLTHQTLGILNAITCDEGGEFFAGEIVQQGAHVGLVGGQFGGDVGNAEILAAEQLLLLDQGGHLRHQVGPEFGVGLVGIRGVIRAGMTFM